RDMLALARAGAQVLHPRSVELAMVNHVPLRLLSSFTPGPGTLVRRLPDEARPRFAGITGRAEAGSLTLAGAGADAAALTESTLLLAQAGIPARSGALEQNAVSLTLAPELVREAMRLLHREMILRQYV
ncbi:MAG: hypothetical protein K6F56_02235, partial [Oscillospiraceae bacterium]|nr:hypothetical protein [Oscillospiraceae bacterium]